MNRDKCQWYMEMPFLKKALFRVSLNVGLMSIINQLLLSFRTVTGLWTIVTAFWKCCNSSHSPSRLVQALSTWRQSGPMSLLSETLPLTPTSLVYLPTNVSKEMNVSFKAHVRSSSQGESLKITNIFYVYIYVYILNCSAFILYHKISHFSASDLVVI